MNWVRLVLDTDRWQAFVNMAMNRRAVRICNERHCVTGKEKPLFPQQERCSVALDSWFVCLFVHQSLS